MAEVFWKRAAESLPLRALLCFAGCAGVALLGQLIRGPVSGMPFVPAGLKHVLFYVWLAACCALGLGFLWFLALEMLSQRRERKAKERRRRVNEYVHMAVQMAGELAASLGGPGFEIAAAKYYGFLFYCIPQVLAPASEIRRIALFVPDCESGEPPTQLRIERACDAFPLAYEKALRLPIDGSIAGKVFQSRKSYSAGRDDSDWYELPDDPMGSYKTVMCSPVVLDENVVAVLSIDHSDVDAFSDEDQEHFELFSRHFGLVWALTHVEKKDGTADAE